MMTLCPSFIMSSLARGVLTVILYINLACGVSVSVQAYVVLPHFAYFTYWFIFLILLTDATPITLFYLILLAIAGYFSLFHLFYLHSYLQYNLTLHDLSDSAWLDLLNLTNSPEFSWQTYLTIGPSHSLPRLFFQRYFIYQHFTWH